MSNNNAAQAVGPASSDDEGSATRLVDRFPSVKLLRNRIQTFVTCVFEFMSLQISEGKSYIMGKKDDTRSCDDNYYLKDLSPIGPSPDIDVNLIHNFIYAVCVEKTANVRCNIIYTSLENRLKTFETCNQPLTQDVLSFSKAGFYYIGDGTNDQMICFSCQQGLMMWQKDDNPWVEHARWSKHCNFVLLNMGKRFVKEICGEENTPKCTYEELNTLITIHKDLANLEKNSKTNIIVKKDNQVGTLAARNACSAPKSSNVSEAMLCKICFKERLEVIFIPCGHLTACVQCAMTLDQCAICRYPFRLLMKVFINLNDKPHGSPNQSLSANPVLCKVCRKNQITITLVPCRHVCLCFDCAASNKECPVCLDKFFAYIQVYL